MSNGENSPYEALVARVARLEEHLEVLYSAHDQLKMQVLSRAFPGDAGLVRLVPDSLGSGSSTTM